MIIKLEDVYLKDSEEIYWTRIEFTSEDRKNVATVVAGASKEYITDHLNICKDKKITDSDLDKWRNDVVDKWKNIGDSIFQKNRLNDPYANNRDGLNNVLNFLEKINT